MKTQVDAALRREALAFALRYRCGDCAHFDAPRGACAEGYPNESHRDAAIETSHALEFCKSFELG